MTWRKRNDAEAAGAPEGVSRADELTRRHAVQNAPASTPLPIRPKPASGRGPEAAGSTPPRRDRPKHAQRRQDSHSHITGGPGTGTGTGTRSPLRTDSSEAAPAPRDAPSTTRKWLPGISVFSADPDRARAQLPPRDRRGAGTRTAPADAPHGVRATLDPAGLPRGKKPAKGRSARTADGHRPGTGVGTDAAAATPRPRTSSRGAVATAGGPAAAFDALYTAYAVGLVRQTYLLTGHQRLAERAVERAFHQAWQHWPEVAVDRDPAGWVRATAYEYALSPWRRLRRVRLRPSSTGPGPGRALVGALLRLPDSYRRALLLHDGVGLGLPETAAESEASTMATAGRLTHGRAALAEMLPELDAAPPARRGVILHRMLSEVAAAHHVRTAPAASVRTGSERRTRLWTRCVLGLTALLAAVTAFVAVHSGTDARNPPQAPGEPGATASPAAGSHAEGPPTAERRS
ncbi:hypothetical protein ABZW18_09560 [Streptomyces sp. NPDC004647]|uniref:hypothetical protein n=1 Tax=Streptomyces sp. NPDC004647 TaxID=3154671 RepID=UPI0033ABB4EC